MAPLAVPRFLAAEEPAHNPIVPLTEEIIVGTIAFAILCIVLMKFVFPRMEQMYKARVEAIEGGLQRAEERQAEAEALFEQYRQQLAGARSDAARIREEARADAEGIRQEIQARAREESERIIAAGREQLSAERQSIVRELRAELGTLAVDLASRIVGDALADEARRRGTVERFLTDLESTPPAQTATAAGGRG
jgi:F-type H+-transporting ATPase subunit b